MRAGFCQGAPLRKDMEFAKSSPVRASARGLEDRHLRPGAFERLAPPWEIARDRERPGAPREPDALRHVLGWGGSR
jgi:hypothetical protein